METRQRKRTTTVRIEPSLANAISSYIIGRAIHDGETVDHAVLREVESRQDDDSFLQLQSGDGLSTFEWNSNTFTFARQRIGLPLKGTCMESAIHEEFALTGPLDAIVPFCKFAVDNSNREVNGTFQVFSWNSENEFWRRDGFVPNRDFHSVVLDETIKRSIVEDLEEFACDETRAWYNKHCITQRRGYQFYGPPGTGKTSTIAAIATHMGRSICRLNLVAPRLTDDSLLRAVSTVKANSIIVMEDLDALFDHHREKRDAAQVVTFSGLLNAIDGLNSPCRGGMIYLFTSNHRERMDPALLRRGRVDRQFHLTFCTKAQTRAMFLRFYPDEDDSANAFTEDVHRKSKQVSPAQLQHHFIKHRKSSASEAACYSVDADEICCESMTMWQ